MTTMETLSADASGPALPEAADIEAASSPETGGGPAAIPLLEVRAAGRSYEGRSGVRTDALVEASFCARDGEFISLLGPSGSGKSTLLNLVGGLDHPTSGEIVFDGVNLAALSGNALASYRAEMVGMLFQNFNLIDYLSALENVTLPMMFGPRPVPRRDRRARAVELLERVGLGHRLNHLATELSGGEQQRVALARALSKRPRMLLADEPTGNLDSKRAERLMGMLHDICKTAGVLVIVATHDEGLAARFSDRIVRLLDGRVTDEQFCRMPPARH